MGKTFDLADFRDQLCQMRKMGGLTKLLDKLPGVMDLPQGAGQKFDDKELVKMEAIIDSMTPNERRFPETIKASRKRRVALGSSTQVQDVNRLLKQFSQMQKMMKHLSKKGGLSRAMGVMKGKLPPGAGF
jgi:signal recognition particle subunit SRP54